MARSSQLVGDEEIQGSVNETQYNGISVDPRTATASELNGWISEKINEYREGAEVGEELWYTYCNDFEDWDKETFKKSGTNKLRNLRDILYSKGVYTAKNNKSIASHLINLLELETLGAWPDDVELPIALLAQKIKEGTRRMDENTEKVTEINAELVRVAEVQKQYIASMTLRRLF